MSIIDWLDWFKFSLLGFYLLLLVMIAAAFLFVPNLRAVLLDIHASNTDTHSWTRYASSFILITAMGIALYQLTYSEIQVEIVSLLVGIAFAGKVTQSGIDKNK